VTEQLIFLLDLLLLGTGSLLACVSLVAFGGARRNAPALLPLGLYTLVAGLALFLLPQFLWQRARTDNAFLGQAVFTLLLVPVGLLLVIVGARAGRGKDQPWTAIVRPILLVCAGTAVLLTILVLRGPGAWQTGSGQFGLDVIAVTVAIGVAIYFLGRRQGGATAKPATTIDLATGRP
jgi:hypothetical protein